MRTRTLPTHTDERGRLLAVEWTDLDYTPARVFSVTDVPAGAVRGDHVATCRETVVLVSGQADVAAGPSAERLSSAALAEPGDAVELDAGEYVRYTLSGPTATIIVLASEGYVGR